jgi:ankyrin repeat protein
MGFVRKILIRGADINYTNKYGKTALHYAVEEGMSDHHVKLLLH